MIFLKAEKICSTGEANSYVANLSQLLKINYCKNSFLYTQLLVIQTKAPKMDNQKTGPQNIPQSQSPEWAKTAQCHWELLELDYPIRNIQVMKEYSLSSCDQQLCNWVCLPCCVCGTGFVNLIRIFSAVSSLIGKIPV